MRLQSRVGAPIMAGTATLGQPVGTYAVRLRACKHSPALPTSTGARVGTRADSRGATGRDSAEQRRPLTEQASGASPPCLNCGDTTPGNYCPVCGQRRGDIRVSLRRLLADVLEDQLSISAALPRTLAAVLFRPGHATNEYLRGRIASYIAPFRLYLVSSLIFFLLLSLLNRVGDISQARERNLPADTLTSIATSPDSAGGGVTAGAGPDSTSASQVQLGRTVTFSMDGDSLGRLTGIEPLDRALRERLRRLGEMEGSEVAEAILPGVLDRLPVAVFLLVPLFAFMLKLLYIRTGRYYIDHFIFALHVHAFAFILFTLMMPVPDAVSRYTTLILLVYLVLAMKRVYAQGWPRTIFKWLTLSGMYGLALGIAIVGAVMVAILTL